MRKEPPAYGHRKGWIPRQLQDYGDGGAFPEIHVVQYPLNMGKKKDGGVSEILIVSLTSHPQQGAWANRKENVW